MRKCELTFSFSQRSYSCPVCYPVPQTSCVILIVVYKRMKSLVPVTLSCHIGSASLPRHFYICLSELQWFHKREKSILVSLITKEGPVSSWCSCTESFLSDLPASDPPSSIYFIYSFLFTWEERGTEDRKTILGSCILGYITGLSTGK